MSLQELCVPVSGQSVNNAGIITVSSYEDFDLVTADAFVLGYMEDRNSNNSGASEAAAAIRKALYKLHTVSKSMRIYDLGDCKLGATIAESYVNLKDCVSQLMIYGKPILIFGGTQEAVCTVAELSFQRVGYPAACFVDARIDWESETTDFSNTNYLSRLQLEHPRTRILHVASQEYLSSREAFSWLNEHNFGMLRLGECNSSISLAEPLIRDAQLVSFDMGSVRYSDNPAGQNVNGLYSEFACQCAWYAGYSPRMNLFCLSEYNPSKDMDSISAQLSAQVLWHALDGISQRKNETTDFEDETYQKRYLKHPMFPLDICFYQSLVSQTMWVEIPIGATNKKRIVPCDSADYEQFRNGIVPELWMTEFRRLAML